MKAPLIPRLLVWFFLASGLAGISGRLRAEDVPVARWEGRTMGSPYLVQVVHANLPQGLVTRLQEEVERCLEEVNRQMSHYRKDSELSRFNQAPAHLAEKVSPELTRVTRFALDLSRQSSGAFDPTLGPLVNLWGFGEAGPGRGEPSETEIQACLARIGWRHLSVTPAGELEKDLEGLSLNLSAVAKGFGVDEMGRVLKSHGLTNWYASIAGEVLVSGHSPRGTRWRVGITAPVDNWREGDPMAGGVEISDRAISTSGDYQKFFRDAQGRRFSHILDPRTGRPVQNEVGGVSVVAPNAMTADGLATTLFVLGPEKGLKLLESWPQASALFLLHQTNGQFRRLESPGFPRAAD